DLVKTTIFYADVEDFATLNDVYSRHMPTPPPARSAPANVKLPHGLLVSIDAIAILPPRRPHGARRHKGRAARAARSAPGFDGRTRPDAAQSTGLRTGWC